MAPRELYPKLIIEATFLVGYCFKEKTKEICTSVLSCILEQSSNDSKHIKSLLITIKLLSPLVNFPYNLISIICATGQPVLTPYCLQILMIIVRHRQ